MAFLLPESRQKEPGGWNLDFAGEFRKAEPAFSHRGIGCWADFPTLGFDADAVYVAANMYGTAGAGTATSLLVLPKAQLVAGSVANRTLFEDLDANGTGFSVQPVINHDGSGLTTVGVGGILLSANTSGFLKASTVTGTVNAPILNTAGGFIG